MLFFAGLEPQGSRRSYLGKLVLSFAVCFTVMSTHVVCFVVLPFIVAAWVIWRWLEARMTELKGAAGVLLRSVGLALSGAAGTLLAFSGNLWCYFKWGEMSALAADDHLYRRPVVRYVHGHRVQAGGNHHPPPFL